jgi:nitrite reductase/ring-hydroxylating ferredoxin subunit
MPDVDVCAESDLPTAGRGKAVLVAGQPDQRASAFFRSTLPPGKTRLALFRRDDGSLFACEDRCPHADAALATGELRDGVLTCSAHGFGFDMETGSCLVRGPGPLVIYPVRVEAGRVIATVPE